MRALFADLYALTMIEAYLRHGMTGTAVFELFVRRLPPPRGFLIAAGLEQAVEALENLGPDAEEMAWLDSCGRFDQATIEWLRALRFEGDLDAMPEGTVFFADEPVLRLTAPLPVAQLVEARLMNIVHFQSLIASKAARLVLAARGRSLVDFGLRRAHGSDAGILAARAAWLAGFDATATVPAGMRFGIPLSGTMAHSFIQAHDDEAAAFAHFAAARPGEAVLLLDTYDTEAAAHKVVALARGGLRVAGVRLDSGDLIAHARAVRAILDAGGLSGVRIVASGGITEADILAHAGVPIDGYGIGSALGVSADVPVLDCAYKIQEYEGQPRRKQSEGKATWPGRKQVWRQSSADGRMRGDVVSLDGDGQPGEPLLVPVLRGGRRHAPLPSLAEARTHAAAQLGRLPTHLRNLGSHPPYRVTIAPALHDLARQVDGRLASRGP